MTERSKNNAKGRLSAARDRIRGTLGRLLAPVDEPPARNPFAREVRPVDVAAFYEAYTDARTALVEKARQRDIDLARSIGSAAALSMHALTEAAFDHTKHGIYYDFGFAYPEVRAQRLANPEAFIDASQVTLNEETRETALEFTQAWIVHAHTQQDEYPERIMNDSFQHMGCSLTVDCLPAGVRFEDLGIQPTSEISHREPSSVFTYLEMNPDMFPNTPIVQDVTRAFQQRVANW